MQMAGMNFQTGSRPL
ncbi:hypothetical protein [Enterocloster sp.]